ncbi:MAG: amino acid ABC transporter permease, partial [Rhodobacteraceae bacterium]|nr:amino acid ABC transporter permease [Paracoccaceae bacterium]
MANTEASFVRKDMLAPQDPPLSERGLVKWMRENLFSGPLNTILTVLALVCLFSLVKLALPWWLHGVWNADSLGECRKIVADRYGPDAAGACWAMIRERWHQFIFGFYPPELYWRPILSFGLLFVALAPALFFGDRKRNLLIVAGVAIYLLLTLGLLDGKALHIALVMAMMAAFATVAWFAPRKLLWFTLIYPALTQWLLWGGSVWGPVLTMMGLVVLALVYRLLVS